MNHPMDYVLAIAYPASALSAPGKNLDLGVRNVSYYRGAKHDIRREVAFRAMDASGDRRLDDSHRWLAPVAWALAQEEKEQLVRALDSLMEPYATVVELHCGQGLSYDEIGHQLRRSPEAVRKLWSRALRRLHDCVNPAAPDHRDRQ
jgi:RNA polymerase sigma factor (sigma-70 family)